MAGEVTGAAGGVAGAGVPGAVDCASALAVQNSVPSIKKAIEIQPEVLSRILIPEFPDPHIIAANPAPVAN